MSKLKFVQISEDVFVNVDKMLCLVKGESGEYRLSDERPGGGFWEVEEEFLPGVMKAMGIEEESPQQRRTDAEFLQAALYGKDLASVAEILNDVALETTVIAGVEMLFRMSNVLKRAAAREKKGA